MSTSTSSRPLIDFSDSRFVTAREYAQDLISRAHDHANTNEVLRAVVNGESVDAYRLNSILPDVFSGCATRAGQSSGRREYTKRARHLAYIARAVLDNHADGLPAYAEGDRSRAVEDMREAVRSATAEVERLTAALEAERIARASWATQCSDLSENLGRVIAERDESAAEVSKLSLVIGYTRGLGTAEQAAQSLGFQHGLENR